MKEKVIFTVSGDPGGANALVPVIEALGKRSTLRLVNFAYSHALEIFEKKNIPTVILPSFSSYQSILEEMKKFLPQFLLTATSCNSINLEVLFIRAANEVEIPSLAIVDFWSNYSTRFCDRNNLRVLPTSIAVMDQKAKMEMLAEGFPKRRIIVTGQPAFDRFGNFRKKMSRVKKNNLRRRLLVSDDSLLLVFVSQPLSSLSSMISSTKKLGFDECVVLRQIIRALEIVSEKVTRPMTLLIRPHPRELEKDLTVFRSEKIRVLVSRDQEEDMLLTAGDLILGMNSVLLLQACLLSRTVVSYQPGLLIPDMLPSNRWGGSIPVYREDDLVPTLVGLLGTSGPKFKKDVRAERDFRNNIGRATENIVNYISEIFLSGLNV